MAGFPPIIRPLAKGDIHRIAPLAAAWQPQFWRFDELLESWQRPDIYGLYCEDVATGETLGTLIYQAGKGLGFGELLFVFVHADARRRGLGEALLGAYHQDLLAKRCLRSFLEVRVENTSAIALYERLGYRKVRLRAGYYGEGKDGLDMIKEIE